MEIMEITEAQKDRGKQLAEDHWNYIQTVLELSGEKAEAISRTEFHYKSAMEHGYKHGLQDRLIGRPRKRRGQGQSSLVEPQE